MPVWLSTSMAWNPESAPLVQGYRIAVALVLGVGVGLLYRWARRGEEVEPTFLPTLVLLSGLIAMATQLIGDNVARAFSLVGALSVVRFRTVVKDTQDTAFVIFAVVVGMAVGSNHLLVGLVGLIVVGCASMLLWPPSRGRGWQAPGNRLVLKLAQRDGVRAAVEAILAASADQVGLTAVSTARKGTLLELDYRLRLRRAASPAAVVSELNALDGVESVELKRGD